MQVLTFKTDLNSLTMFFLRLLFTALFLSVGTLLAQTSLTGSITDATTGQPVEFATVYLAGTSIGDVSARDGSFRIKVPAANNQGTLVVSHLNYQTLNTPLSALSSEGALKLVPKAAELTSIEVEDDDRRADNVAEFHNVLMGKDAWGSDVVIYNPDALTFNRDVERKTVKRVTPDMATLLRQRNLRDAVWAEDGRSVTYSYPRNLRATTNGPLRVFLPDLGYELHIDLARFVHDYKSRQMSYLGTKYFIPAAAASPRDQRRFERNRAKAYYGSGMHFLRSLIGNTLAEDGFQVVEVLQEPSATRLQKIKAVNLRNHLRQNDEGNYILLGLSQNQYAVLYHGRRRAPSADPVLRNSSNILQFCAYSPRRYPGGYQPGVQRGHRQPQTRLGPA